MFEGLLQPMHLLLIAVIAMLVFGPQKLPQIGKSLGEGIRGFREAIKNAEKGASADDSHTSIDTGTQIEKK
jgi:sec-independent protein translocase protein TatA